MITGFGIFLGYQQEGHKIGLSFLIFLEEDYSSSYFRSIGFYFKWFLQIRDLEDRFSYKRVFQPIESFLFFVLLFKFDIFFSKVYKGFYYDSILVNKASVIIRESKKLLYFYELYKFFLESNGFYLPQVWSNVFVFLNKS